VLLLALDIKLATVIGCESANNSTFTIPLEVLKITIFSLLWHLRVNSLQKYRVFSLFLYPHELIKNTKNKQNNFLENFCNKSILFPPN